MTLLRTGIQMAGTYAIVKSATGAMEKHDQNKYNHQQQYQQPQQPQQFIPQQQSSRAPEGGQTYGKYVAPDGTEYPVYQPQPQFQGGLQPVQPQFQNNPSRSIGNEPYQPQYDQRSSRQGSASPMQQHQHSQQGFVEPPPSSTPPAYHQYDRKN